MNSRKVFLFFLTLANLTGLTYLLSLGLLSLPALDDYAFLTYMRQYGFNSSFTYWYSHWQGRFTAHYAINTQWVLMLHNFPLLFFYAIEMIIGVYGTYNFIKNALVYVKIPVEGYKWSILNAACFIVVISLYSNFEFNTFYWLNVSAMYVGGVVFFILGFSEVISPSKKLYSYIIAMLSFLYMGGSAENFAFIGILLTGLFLLSILLFTPRTSFSNYLKMPVIQKALLSLASASCAFLIMVAAPGNVIRMHVINTMYNGYKTVPIPLSQLPFEVFTGYKILLVIVFSKLPILLSVLPVFAVIYTTRVPIPKSHLKVVAFFLLFFILSLSVFILPTMYATGGLGPLRSFTYLIFFLFLFAFYVAFVVGNIYQTLLKGLTVLSIFVLLAWSIIFTRDFLLQFPEMKKYNQSELNRLKYLSDLKTQKKIRGYCLRFTLHTSILFIFK
jgi:hypothetical protein